jgi:hypothetical protein
MIPTLRILSAATALILVIGSGLVYGLWTGRWDPPTESPDMTGIFERIPLELGDWRGIPVESDVRGAGPILGHVERRYTNQRTRDIITISLVCGKPGPVAIHTPDVCYGSSGYDVGACRRLTPPHTEKTEFWTADAKKQKSTEQLRLRIFWAWNGGDGWQAADNPRLAFVRYPLLYKLYLIRELPATGDGLDDDPCVDLFHQLAPELQRALFSPPS